MRKAGRFVWSHSCSLFFWLYETTPSRSYSSTTVAIPSGWSFSSSRLGCSSCRLRSVMRTIESYRAEVMDKMRAESVAALLLQAIRLGRITP
jgi:hypothetical protein